MRNNHVFLLIKFRLQQSGDFQRIRNGQINFLFYDKSSIGCRHDGKRINVIGVCITRIFEIRSSKQRELTRVVVQGNQVTIVSIQQLIGKRTTVRRGCIQLMRNNHVFLLIEVRLQQRSDFVNVFDDNTYRFSDSKTSVTRSGQDKLVDPIVIGVCWVFEIRTYIEFEFKFIVIGRKLELALVRTSDHGIG